MSERSERRGFAAHWRQVKQLRLHDVHNARLVLIRMCASVFPTLDDALHRHHLRLEKHA